MNMETVKAIVVRGVTHGLPIAPTNWINIEEVDEKVEFRKLELARHIETTVHQNTWTKGDSDPPTKITHTIT